MSMTSRAKFKREHKLMTLAVLFLFVCFLFVSVCVHFACLYVCVGIYLFRNVEDKINVVISLE